MQASKLLGWQRTTATTPVPQELIIEPGQSIAHYWRDRWRYRELFFFLAWRDLAVRDKQTRRLGSGLWYSARPNALLPM